MSPIKELHFSKQQTARNHEWSKACSCRWNEINPWDETKHMKQESSQRWRWLTNQSDDARTWGSGAHRSVWRDHCGGGVRKCGVNWGEMGILGSLDLAGRLGDEREHEEPSKKKGCIDVLESKGSTYILSNTFSWDIFKPKDCSWESLKLLLPLSSPTDQNRSPHISIISFSLLHLAVIAAATTSSISTGQWINSVSPRTPPIERRLVTW